MMTTVRKNGRTVRMFCRRRAVPRDRERADASAVLFLFPFFFSKTFFFRKVFFFCGENEGSLPPRRERRTRKLFFLTLKNA